jgi:nucleoid DNA-binding protein
MNTVPRDQFTRLVVEQFAGSVTLKDAEIIVDGVIKALIESLKIGGDVRIFGFGSFRGVVRPSRDGYNPRTGEAIRIPAKITVKFKPSPNLKRTIEPFLTADKVAPVVEVKKERKVRKPKAVAE